MRAIIYSVLVLSALGMLQASSVHAQSLRDHIAKDFGGELPPPSTEAESAQERMQNNVQPPPQLGQTRQRRQKATSSSTSDRHNDAKQQMLNQEFTAGQRQRMMQLMTRRDLTMDTGQEPFFEPVKYIKIPPAGSLTERIDRLVQGISIDVPPKYDPYGHEVRRYMASIAGPDVFASQETLQEQIANIKKAEIIMDYWIKAFRKEIKAIEAEIEKRDASSNIRTSFKYNRGVANAFYAEAFTWAKNNRELLEYLADVNADNFDLLWPTITFKNQENYKQFKALLEVRREALAQIQEYTPFRVMIY